MQSANAVKYDAHPMPQTAGCNPFLLYQFSCISIRRHIGHGQGAESVVQRLVSGATAGSLTAKLRRGAGIAHPTPFEMLRQSRSFTLRARAC